MPAPLRLCPQPPPVRHPEKERIPRVGWQNFSFADDHIGPTLDGPWNEIVTILPCPPDGEEDAQALISVRLQFPLIVDQLPNADVWRKGEAGKNFTGVHGGKIF
jgi:hypothetical protein